MPPRSAPICPRPSWPRLSAMRTIEVDGLRVSRIGLGTWQFGSREWGYGDDYLRETAPALLRRAIELGITMIDTAEAYGPARSEAVILVCSLHVVPLRTNA